MKKKLILLISLGILVISGALVGIFWDPIIDWLPIDQSGWYVLENGGQCYLDEDGDPITGWQELDSNIYYFDPDSFAMQIRWLELEDGRYYLGDDGIRRTGWQTIGEQRYYLGDNGAMHTGWLDQDGGRMYLNDRGNPHSGWLTLKDGTYYIKDDFFMHTGWLELDGIRYYLDEDGDLHRGWLEQEEGKYYLSKDGIPMTGWQDIDENRYYFGEDGIMHTGWLELDGQKYYLKEDGTIFTGWLELDSKYYYLKEDGTAARGALTINDKQYFFSSAGVNLIMVNTWNKLPDGYNVDLVKLSNGKQSAAECAEILQKMVDDCTAAGCSPNIIGAYRTINDQQVLLNNGIAQKQEQGYGYSYARQLTLQRVALPGHSEHHLGLAFDITDRRYPQRYTGENNAVVWLAEHCWEYGFILRYPEDKSHITGIMGEPWHFRYVGVELAMELKESGLCLEEYLDQLTGDGSTCGNPAYAKKK